MLRKRRKKKSRIEDNGIFEEKTGKGTALYNNELRKQFSYE
jgi:hypothetical protein